MNFHMQPMNPHAMHGGFDPYDYPPQPGPYHHDPHAAHAPYGSMEPEGAYVHEYHAQLVTNAALQPGHPVNVECRRLRVHPEEMYDILMEKMLVAEQQGIPCRWSAITDSLIIEAEAEGHQGGRHDHAHGHLPMNHPHVHGGVHGGHGHIGVGGGGGRGGTGEESGGHSLPNRKERQWMARAERKRNSEDFKMAIAMGDPRIPGNR